MKFLTDQETIDQLMSHLDLKNDDQTLRSTLDVLSSIYSKYPSSSESNTASSFAVDLGLNEDKELQEDQTEILLESITKNLDFVINIIEKETDSKVSQQYGSPIKPFGFTKIRAIQFLSQIVKIGDINLAIQLSSTFSYILKQCQANPWNSALHNLTVEIFTLILKSNSPYPVDYRTAFLEDTDILAIISSLDADYEF